MIKADGKNFILNTENTTYVFRVMETGQLEHLYYGARIRIDDAGAIEEKRAFAPGNTTCYNSAHPEITLEDVRLEMSSIGKGDIREPMIEVVCADGSSTLDFVYDSYEILSGKTDFKTLPGGLRLW